MMSSETPHVLVVEDEEDVLRYLSAILEDEGFRVSTATNGDEALEIVRGDRPDLISLDLVMPGKSGTKFLFALRKDRDWSRIPVLVVTGHAHDDLGKNDLDDILSGKVISGPAVYLEKPVTPQSYVAAVRKQLGAAAQAVDAGPAPAPKPDLAAEIRDRLAGADPETMKKILEMLEREGGE